jgi:hypothetical protein
MSMKDTIMGIGGAMCTEPSGAQFYFGLSIAGTKKDKTLNRSARGRA